MASVTAVAVEQLRAVPLLEIQALQRRFWQRERLVPGDQR
jgi:hypothetical protein